MISECHVRSCATEIQHNLDACYEVSSFVKPGAGIDTVVNTAGDEIRKLRTEDVVVIWGGANDISKNNTKVALKHVCNFVKKEVIILIMKSPNIHDLIPSSPVNNEMLNFNRQVEKKMKVCNNVKMLETDLNRKYSTKHGQHLKLSGKELICMKLTIFIKEFSTKKLLSPIFL
jgi:hypothetical protein